MQGDRDLALIDADLLPPQIRELVRLIGLPETLRLLDARGGLPTYIPRRADGPTDLEEILTRDAIRQLAGQWPGERIDVPKADKIRAQVRNQYINESLSRGLKSGPQLARELGLSYRWVKAIRAGAQADAAEPDTGDLFALDSAR